MILLLARFFPEMAQAAADSDLRASIETLSGLARLRRRCRSLAGVVRFDPRRFDARRFDARRFDARRFDPRHRSKPPGSRKILAASSRQEAEKRHRSAFAHDSGSIASTRSSPQIVPKECRDRRGITKNPLGGEQIMPFLSQCSRAGGGIHRSLQPKPLRYLPPEVAFSPLDRRAQARTGFSEFLIFGVLDFRSP